VQKNDNQKWTVIKETIMIKFNGETNHHLQQLLEKDWKETKDQCELTPKHMGSQA